MSELKIKNCPFCQSQPSISSYKSASGETLVYCGNVKCAIWLNKCRESRWNHRTPDVNAELVGALKLCRAKFKEGEDVEEWLSPDFTNEMNAIDSALNKAQNKE